MNFYITLIKQRRKFDKYIKINRVRNKIIVDINELMNDYEIENDSQKHKDYFNLMVYTRINHGLKRGKDIYYIPDFSTNEIKIEQLFKLKEMVEFDINFNVLLFYDEFIDDKEILNEVFDNLSNFNSSQIIKDY